MTAESSPAASGASSIRSSSARTLSPRNRRRPDWSIAVSICGSSRVVKAASAALRSRSPSQSAIWAAKSTSPSFRSTASAARKLVSMKAPRLSAMRRWLRGMIAVCGIGRPSGRRNSATTAYQSASPPTVAAEAKAAT